MTDRAYPPDIDLRSQCRLPLPRRDELDAEAQRVYSEIASLEPPGGPASEKLVELYVAGRDYAKLAELRERQLGAIEDPAARVPQAMELGALVRYKLGDEKKAISKACSDQADQKGLHGKDRKKFRSACIKNGGKPQ